MRKLNKIDKRVIEDIMVQSLKHVGIQKFTDKQSALLLRLVFSGIANYFYHNPDDTVEIGFIKLKKNPDKEEIFAVDLLPNHKDGVTNADTLYRYYKGDLIAEEEIKETMENFVSELLSYSQNQNSKITNITSRLQRKGGAKNGF